MLLSKYYSSNATIWTSWDQSVYMNSSFTYFSIWFQRSKSECNANLDQIGMKFCEWKMKKRLALYVAIKILALNSDFFTYTIFFYITLHCDFSIFLDRKNKKKQRIFGNFFYFYPWNSIEFSFKFLFSKFASNSANFWLSSKNVWNWIFATTNWFSWISPCISDCGNNTHKKSTRRKFHTHQPSWISSTKPSKNHGQ